MQLIASTDLLGYPAWVIPQLFGLLLHFVLFAVLYSASPVKFVTTHCYSNQAA
jgi:hypothetical protein